MRVLAGDIGGTKTLLQITAVDGSRCTALHARHYASADYISFTALLTDFLATTPPELCIALDGVCFGVAGPVTAEGTHSQTTNLPWIIDSGLLAQACRIPQPRLINDFVAVAWGIDALQTDELVTLQRGAPQPRAPRMVLGAGTGLGVCQSVWCGGGYLPLPSEGSHADFAPSDAQQIELLRHFQRHFERVSWERVLSGAGLLEIYRFLGAQHTHPDAALPVHTTPAEVSDAALLEQPSLAREALQLFCTLYGAQAGNLALFNLAYGGVYIAGGIAPKILPLLRKSGFMEAFVRKGRMTPLLRDMPVHIITHPEVGLLGAALHAARR